MQKKPYGALNQRKLNWYNRFAALAYEREGEWEPKMGNSLNKRMDLLLF